VPSVPRLPNGEIDMTAMWLMNMDATRAILYWSDLYRPHDFVGRPNPRAAEAVDLLRKPSYKMGWMGYAHCRICKESLGTHDFSAHGFVWPEKAEHYILAHGLWIPDLDDLLAAAKI
jgi:hypothetical protein